jgi:hypothetical protein
MPLNKEGTAKAFLVFTAWILIGLGTAKDGKSLIFGLFLSALVVGSILSLIVLGDAADTREQEKKTRKDQ